MGVGGVLVLGAARCSGLPKLVRNLSQDSQNVSIVRCSVIHPPRQVRSKRHKWQNSFCHKCHWSMYFYGSQTYAVQRTMALLLVRKDLTKSIACIHFEIVWLCLFITYVSHRIPNWKRVVIFHYLIILYLRNFIKRFSFA